MQNRLGRRLLPLIQVENTLSLRGSVLWLSTTNHPLHSPFPIHPRPYLTPSPPQRLSTPCVCSWIYTCIYSHTSVCSSSDRDVVSREKKGRRKGKRLISKRFLLHRRAKRRARFLVDKTRRRGGNWRASLYEIVCIKRASSSWNRTSWVVVVGDVVPWLQRFGDPPKRHVHLASFKIEPSLPLWILDSPLDERKRGIGACIRPPHSIAILESSLPLRNYYRC